MTAALGEESSVGDLLLREWRMIERVSLTPCPDGDGFDAAIELNPTLVRAAGEQQGFARASATMAEAERRRSKAIAECLERVNAELPSSSRVRSFRLVG